MRRKHQTGIKLGRFGENLTDVVSGGTLPTGEEQPAPIREMLDRSHLKGHNAGVIM